MGEMGEEDRTQVGDYVTGGGQGRLPQIQARSLVRSTVTPGPLRIPISSPISKHSSQAEV